MKKHKPLRLVFVVLLQEVGILNLFRIVSLTHQTGVKKISLNTITLDQIANFGQKKRLLSEPNKLD